MLDPDVCSRRGVKAQQCAIQWIFPECIAVKTSGIRHRRGPQLFLSTVNVNPVSLWETAVFSLSALCAKRKLSRRSRWPTSAAAVGAASTQRLTQQGVDGKSVLRLTGAYHNLLRMWVDA
ncbi:hypothetical protein [Burkholderia aenigmatica]|uniref:hypothetical protein n=1 Tax=Burkholderia aenigmatica TaxID=2015348 RepID=UPI0015841C95|nr:hypothetical protein [Burkholderia aenigmatica]